MSNFKNILTGSDEIKDIDITIDDLTVQTINGLPAPVFPAGTANAVPKYTGVSDPILTPSGIEIDGTNNVTGASDITANTFIGDLQGTAETVDLVDNSTSLAVHRVLITPFSEPDPSQLFYDTSLTYIPSLNVLNVPTIRTDQISESTTDNGVGIETLNVKDKTLTFPDQDFLPPAFELNIKGESGNNGVGIFNEVSAFPNFRDGVALYSDTTLGGGFPNLATYVWGDGVLPDERRTIIGSDINQIVGKAPSVAQGTPSLNFLNNTVDTFLDTPPKTGIFIEPNGADVDFGFMNKSVKTVEIEENNILTFTTQNTNIIASDIVDISSVNGTNVSTGDLAVTTGNVTVGNGTIGRAIKINGPVSGSNIIDFQSGGLNRWRIDVSGAESGGDQGAQFRLRAFDDSGVEKGTALYCARTDLSFVSGGNFRRLGSATTATCGTSIFPWAESHSVEDVVTTLIRSRVNNVATLGNSIFRFNEIFCTNGTINTSDRSLKKNITPLGDTLADPVSFLMSLKPVMYKWRETDEKGPDDEEGNPTVVKVPAGNRFHLGLIAQDVEASLDAVGVDKTTFGAWTKDTETGLQGIRYTELVPLLIHANQKMIKKIQSLEARITVLEN